VRERERARERCIYKNVCVRAKDPVRSVRGSAQISTRVGTHSAADPNSEEIPRSRSAFQEDAPAA